LLRPDAASLMWSVSWGSASEPSPALPVQAYGRPAASRRAWDISGQPIYQVMGLTAWRALRSYGRLALAGSSVSGRSERRASHRGARHPEMPLTVMHDEPCPGQGMPRALCQRTPRRIDGHRATRSRKDSRSAKPTAPRNCRAHDTGQPVARTRPRTPLLPRPPSGSAAHNG
jgi:hypothetical protein